MNSCLTASVATKENPTVDGISKTLKEKECSQSHEQERDTEQRDKNTIKRADEDSSEKRAEERKSTPNDPSQPEKHQHKTPEWLTLVDHTADAGIVVEAPDLARLFERAACGMFCVISDLVAVQAMETSRISIEAPDRAALLVRWLSELNYRHVTEHRVFSKFEVLTLSEHHLGAEVSGEIFDPARHTIFTEIKAVTFHDLQLAHDERGWKAQIIFDL
jgi:SHS2 domain-containing protein